MDSYFVQAAVMLERGKVNAEQLLESMQSDGVFERADGEHVKVLLRGALMGEQVYGRDSGQALAVVAREVATRLHDPDIDYGLPIGVADAVVCADFVLAGFLVASGEVDKAVGLQLEIAERALAYEDSKGALEALEEVADLEFAVELHTDSARHYAEALALFDGLDDPSESLVDYSSQDMLRLDTKNVARFGGTAATPYGDGCFLKSRLLERLARTSLLSGADGGRCWAMAAEAASLRTIEAAAQHPEQQLDLLATQLLIGMATGRSREAASFGQQFVDLALRLGQVEVAARTAAITAHLYREVGLHGEAGRLQARFT